MTQIDRQDDQQNDSESEARALAGEQDKTASSLIRGSSELTNQSYGLKFTLESGESKLFTSLPISLGRADDNDIVLPNETVSAHHAQIYYDETVNGICIVDFDSLNGLFIGDQPTHRNVLYDGSKIGLGAATLIFRDTGFIYPG
jgi:pSer/pThr/pTyr-binding forkhead associated (FHA) protein